MTGETTGLVIEIVVVRAATFGMIGIGGGEICSRIKYFFARFEDGLSIDEHSRLYNQRFVCQLLETNLAESRRYGTEFSVATIALSPLLTSELRPAKARSLVRTVADHIRYDVRLIDDAGRLDDGRFILLLPHTSKTGGRVASDRVQIGVRNVLGAKDESVTVSLLGSTEDLDAIQTMLESLRKPETAPAALAASPEQSA